MAGFRIHDPRFADVLGDDPRLVRVVDADAHEGPVYRAAEDAAYFTTTPRPGTHETAILRLALDGEQIGRAHV
jgi:gluconolactonase